MAAFGGVSFTPADLILNLNKRVRQCYIRRRLLTTYKALERLSQSQFNLDQIAAVAEAAGNQQTVTSSDAFWLFLQMKRPEVSMAHTSS